MKRTGGGITEPASAPEIFISEVARMERAGGGCWRLYCTVDRPPIDDEDAPPEQMLIVTIVVPGSALVGFLRMVRTARRQRRTRRAGRASSKLHVTSGVARHH